MTVSGIAMDRHSSSKPIHRYSMSTDRKDIVGHEALVIVVACIQTASLMLISAPHSRKRIRPTALHA